MENVLAKAVCRYFRHTANDAKFKIQMNNKNTKKD